MATAEPFVPADFDPPTALVTDRFRLEPLGPQHNTSDHDAWMSSIEHIRTTPGYPDGDWPPTDGVSSERNLAHLTRHADDFARRVGFTFTVLDLVDEQVIGCVYLYPPESDSSEADAEAEASTHADADVEVLSWVRADRADLDEPLAETVATWLTTAWPWERVRRPGR